jgi:hypothetical protein
MSNDGTVLFCGNPDGVHTGDLVRFLGGSKTILRCSGSGCGGAVYHIDDTKSVIADEVPTVDELATAGASL